MNCTPSTGTAILCKILRGKYAKRVAVASNAIVLRPEVARAFPNDEAVNDALASLVDIAKKSTKETAKPARNRIK